MSEDEEYDHEVIEEGAFPEEADEAVEEGAEEAWQPPSLDQGRPSGSTKIHDLPENIREEIELRLATRTKLSRVRSWLVSKGCGHITERMLRYYRDEHMDPKDIVGEPYMTKFLNRLGHRIDALNAQTELVLIQAARLEVALKEEKEMGLTIPQVARDIEVLDSLIGRNYRMQQDLELVKPPATRSQRVDFGLADQKGEDKGEGLSGTVALALEAARRGLREMAAEAEEAKMMESDLQEEAGGENE